MKWTENTVRWLLFLALLCAMGCSKRDLRPVDIYPEDVCTLCKMAISDARFASEIVTPDDGALKFDDIGCLRNYRRLRTDQQTGRVFYRDYGGGQWLNEERAVILETGAPTPMGSGLVAFADSLQARAFLHEHPLGDLQE